jgi:3-deoxy-D-manno-octulosonic-acid transferase
METELWPNLFDACEQRGIPLVLASARLSAKSVSRYRRLGSLCRRLFSAVSLIAAQTREDAERFLAIGAQSARTHVVGNIKFDRELGGEVAERGRELRSAFGDARPVWIAGSTHAGEEEQVLAAHAALAEHTAVVGPAATAGRTAAPGDADLAGHVASGSDPLLLLVPRHPDRFAGVADVLSRRGLRFTRRSSGAMPDPSTQVVLVDTVGELAALYAAADVAFVGGSLVPIGGHNLLEPAALGLAVLTGPYHFNSKEIAHLLLSQGAARQVADASELAAVLTTLLADPQERQRMGAAGRRIVESNRGSIARLLALIAPLLEDSP